VSTIVGDNLSRETQKLHQPPPIKRASVLKETLRGVSVSNLMRKIGNVINSLTSPLARRATSSKYPSQNLGEVSNTVTDKLTDLQTKLLEAEADLTVSKLKGENTVGARATLQSAKQDVRNAELQLAATAPKEGKDFNALKKATYAVAESKFECKHVIDIINQRKGNQSASDYLSQ